MKRWAIPCLAAAAFGLWFAMGAGPAEAPQRPTRARFRGELPDEEAGVALGEAIRLASPLTEAGDAYESLRRAAAVEGPPAEENRASWTPYADAIDALHRLLARPGLSVPAGLEEMGILPLQAVAKAMIVRGWERARTEGPEAGAADMIAVLKLANRLADAADEGLHVVVAFNLRSLALRELAELIASWPEVGVLDAVRVGLLANPPPRGAAARVLDAECARGMDRVAAEVAAPGAVLEAMGLREPVEAAGLPVTVANAVVRAVAYDREDTEAFLRQRCDDAAAQLLLAPAVRQDFLEVPELDWAFIQNPVGRSRVDIGAFALRAANLGDRAKAMQAVLLTAVAARLHRAEAGALPASVAALVPRWLPSVPSDPFRSGGIRIEHAVVVSAAPPAEPGRLSGPTRLPI